MCLRFPERKIPWWSLDNGGLGKSLGLMKLFVTFFFLFWRYFLFALFDLQCDLVGWLFLDAGCGGAGVGKAMD